MIHVITGSVLLTPFFVLVVSQSTNVSLSTKKGPIVGLRYDPNPATGVSYQAFLGIPYGNVTTRFQVAEAPSSWSSPLYTQSDGPVCPQPGVDFSEDCLFLNVFTPLSASITNQVPVMVFIHGAGFTQGSSTSKTFGPDFLVNASVILVTMNYRLGAAGFLTLGSKVAPGNLGLQDTLLALQWVQDEISTFGGDPTQVTLFGHSSGSVMVHMHYLSSLSTDMFVRVIAESGSALTDWGHYNATEGTRRAKVLAQAVNCDTTQSDSAILNCLQLANIKDIVNNQFIDGIITYSDKMSGNYRVFLPVLDSQLTSDTPFFNDSLDNLMSQALTRAKPMITGVTTDEGILKFAYDFWRTAEGNLSAFIPYKAQSTLNSQQKAVAADNIRSRYFPDTPDLNKVRSLVSLYTDYGFAYPSVQMSRYFNNVTYGYLFAYDGSWAQSPSSFSQFQMLGVGHGAELLYLFYMSVSQTQGNSTCLTNLPNVIVKNQLVNWWTTFAKSGVPGPDWQTVADGGYLVINNSLSTISSSAFEERYYNFWANMSTTQANSSATAGKLAPLLVIYAVCSVWLSM